MTNKISEWERRAQGKYGNALKGEALVMVAETLGLAPTLTPFEKVTSWLDRITYKPGWRIEPYVSERDNVLWIEFISDSRRPESRKLAITYEYFGRLDFDRFVVLLRREIHNIERREVDEWLLVDGERCGAPHDPA